MWFYVINQNQRSHTDNEHVNDTHFQNLLLYRIIDMRQNRQNNIHNILKDTYNVLSHIIIIVITPTLVKL